MNDSCNMALDLGHYISIVLIRVQHISFKACDRELQKIGLTWKQLSVLHEIICMDGAATPHKIAKRMVLEPHTLSSIITRMEKIGLITKRKDLESHKMVRIELTEKAFHLMELAGDVLNDFNNKWISCLSREEAIQLADYLSRLCDHNLSYVYRNKKLTPFTYK